MRRLHKWLIVGSGSTVGLLLIATLAISWISGQSLLHPEREQPPETPTSVGLAWTWANFTTEDNVPLVGGHPPATTRRSSSSTATPTRRTRAS